MGELAATSFFMYDGYNDEQEKEIMTNSTGSPNLAGLFGNIFETIKTVDGFIAQAFDDTSDGTKERGFADEEAAKEAEPKKQYKAVSNLGLSDALVLEDGSWQVVAIEEDSFDADRVTVYLDNGEAYDLIRTSLVWVV